MLYGRIEVTYIETRVCYSIRAAMVMTSYLKIRFSSEMRSSYTCCMDEP